MMGPGPKDESILQQGAINPVGIRLRNRTKKGL